MRIHAEHIYPFYRGRWRQCQHPLSNFAYKARFVFCKSAENCWSFKCHSLPQDRRTKYSKNKIRLHDGDTVRTAYSLAVACRQIDRGSEIYQPWNSAIPWHTHLSRLQHTKFTDEQHGQKDQHEVRYQKMASRCIMLFVVKYHTQSLYRSMEMHTRNKPMR